MAIENTSRATIEQNFANIRRVIESRIYDELNPLLAEQRVLIGSLPFADPEAQAYFAQVQDLTAWSLTMLRMQRSALEQSLAAVVRLRQIEEYQLYSAAPTE